MADAQFLDFPPLAQDFTPEQVEATVNYLAKLELSELRRRQSIHQQQVARAIEQGKRNVAESEQIKLDMTTEAVSRHAFGGRKHPDARPVLRRKT